MLILLRYVIYATQCWQYSFDSYGEKINIKGSFSFTFSLTLDWTKCCLRPILFDHANLLLSSITHIPNVGQKKSKNICKKLYASHLPWTNHNVAAFSQTTYTLSKWWSVENNPLTYIKYPPLTIWAVSWQNQQNDMHPAKTQISLGIHPVWSVFAVRMKKPWILSYPLSAQRRLWSDWADALADLNLRWAQFFCWFCREVAVSLHQCFMQYKCFVFPCFGTISSLLLEPMISSLSFIKNFVC